MQLIKAAVCLTLLGSLNHLIGMDPPNKPYNPGEEFYKGVFGPEGFDQEKYQRRADSFMAPFRNKFETIAKAVCKDLNIENGGYVYVRDGIRAPAGSIQRQAFEKFSLLCSAIDRCTGDANCTVATNDIRALFNMLEMREPINVDRLRRIIKPSC